jgi:hypothetical protein
LRRSLLAEFDVRHRKESGINDYRRDFCSEIRVSDYFSGLSRNLLAKSEFNGYSIYYEIKTQLREECSSDVGFWVRNFHHHYCARRSARSVPPV